MDEKLPAEPRAESKPRVMTLARLAGAECEATRDAVVGRLLATDWSAAHAPISAFGSSI